MLKIFLRKRFVCGHKRDICWDKNSKPFDTVNRWRTSFNSVEEARKWFKYNEFSRAILFDRKTKCLVNSIHKSIEDYLKEQGE